MLKIESHLSNILITILDSNYSTKLVSYIKKNYIKFADIVVERNTIVG